MKKLILLFVISAAACACSTSKKTAGPTTVITEKGLLLNGPIHYTAGIPCYNSTNITYKRSDNAIFKASFKSPVLIDVAKQPEKWGHFQFPDMDFRSDGILQVKWSMKDDAMSAYGVNSYGSAVSTDKGKTWKLTDNYQDTRGLLLPNGDRIQITTPVPIKTEGLNMPPSLGESTRSDTYSKVKYRFYRLNDLPANCQAVYLKRLKKGTSAWVEEQDKLTDPNAVRHTTSGVLPVIWWGDMQVASDGSIIAGIYPGRYIRPDGSVGPKSEVFFYRSTDMGHTWNIQGRIFYKADNVADPHGENRMGFTEPAFQILQDGTFLCVARTTDGLGIGPMYASYSADMGRTWTAPDIITQNGVKPRILKLDNGVLVLASGRPGVQLRFDVSGTGKQWSDPFEMLPYDNEKDQVSCGYVDLVPVAKNSFLIVYSDFKYKTQAGEIRKAIKVREITIDPK